jgi:hypothetical protein
MCMYICICIMYNCIYLCIIVCICTYINVTVLLRSVKDPLEGKESDVGWVFVFPQDQV